MGVVQLDAVSLHQPLMNPREGVGWSVIALGVL